MAERVRVREISNQEGTRLLRHRAPVDRVGGDLAAGADGAAHRQGMGVAQIAQVTFTSPDRVRDVLHNFNEAKKNRILHLYGLMDGTTDVLDGDPEVTTTARTCRLVTTRGSASGHRPTTPSWPMCPPMPRGSTGSRPSSPRCAPSPWTAPTTPATPSRQV